MTMISSLMRRRCERFLSSLKRCATPLVWGAGKRAATSIAMAIAVVTSANAGMLSAPESLLSDGVIALRLNDRESFYIVGQRRQDFLRVALQRAGLPSTAAHLEAIRIAAEKSNLWQLDQQGVCRLASGRWDADALQTQFDALAAQFARAQRWMSSIPAYQESLAQGGARAVAAMVEAYDRWTALSPDKTVRRCVDQVDRLPEEAPVRHDQQTQTRAADDVLASVLARSNHTSGGAWMQSEVLETVRVAFDFGAQASVQWSLPGFFKGFPVVVCNARSRGIAARMSSFAAIVSDPFQAERRYPVIVVSSQMLELVSQIDDARLREFVLRLMLEREAAHLDAGHLERDRTERPAGWRQRAQVFAEAVALLALLKDSKASWLEAWKARQTLALLRQKIAPDVAQEDVPEVIERALLAQEAQQGPAGALAKIQRQFALRSIDAAPESPAAVMVGNASFVEASDDASESLGFEQLNR